MTLPTEIVEIILNYRHQLYVAEINKKINKLEVKHYHYPAFSCSKIGNKLERFFCWTCGEMMHIIRVVGIEHDTPVNISSLEQHWGCPYCNIFLESTSMIAEINCRSLSEYNNKTRKFID